MFNVIKTWLHRNTVRIEPFINGRGKWQSRIVAWNGEKLHHSEEYDTMQGCFDTIRSLEGKKIITSGIK